MKKEPAATETDNKKSASLVPRRSFLRSTAAGLGAALATRAVSAGPGHRTGGKLPPSVMRLRSSRPITGTTLGPIFRYNRPETFIYGDSFTTTWADDGELYSIADDTKGFDDVLRPSGGRNLSINAYGATAPPDLRGTTINSMDVYGTEGQRGTDAEAQRKAANGDWVSLARRWRWLAIEKGSL